ncbi:MAG: hypothetical protein JJU28_21130 [Cyclobacteriaceae bacterium]|nr:hypothetical protein [Cyclobacteriaceae bacterium]
MKVILQLISFAGLVLTIIPALLTFSGIIGMDTNKSLMLVGMILWFASAPLWMHKKREDQV